MFGQMFNKRKDFEEGFATGYFLGADIAYGTIRMVLEDYQQPFTKSGHANACICKPCELIREVLASRGIS